MADERNIENRRHVGRLMRTSFFWSRNLYHADIGYVTKTEIFANSKWRTAAIFENSFISISQL